MALVPEHRSEAGRDLLLGEVLPSICKKTKNPQRPVTYNRIRCAQSRTLSSGREMQVTSLARREAGPSQR